MLNCQNACVTAELGLLVESGVKLWDFEYPSYYTGEAKTAFEQKVIDHYRFRQIGQETPGRFLHLFRSRIREIMPYYIQLYKSQELMESIDDPFGNVDITETFEQHSTGESSGNSEHTQRFSDTPQGRVDNIDHHLTNATVDDNSGRSESSGTVRHTFTKKGNQGVNTYAHDMKELRETFLNIDMQIINDLNDLFLGLY